MTEYQNQPAATGPAGYSATQLETIKKKALIWTIAGFLCGGVVAGILGLLGYLKADTEPATAEKFTKWAKIVTIVIIVLNVLIWILVAILMATGAMTMETTTY